MQKSNIMQCQQLFECFFVDTTDSNLCRVEEPTIPLPPKDLECTQNRNTDSKVATIFIFTQLLRGIGMVPLKPFGLSYLNEFGSERNIPIYIGLINTIGIVGPALAFLLSSAVLQFYVDFEKSLNYGLTPSDPRWVGAWWLGFLIIASLVTISSIPYFFFPRAMPQEGSDKLKGWKSKRKHLLKSQTRGSALQNNSLGKYIKNFPVTLFGMLKNPVFLFTVLARCNLHAVLAGQSTFITKYMEIQFSIATPFANILMGSFILPITATGIILGSVVMKKYKFTQKKTASFCCVGIFISIIVAIPTLFLGCSTRRIAGINDNGISRNTTSSLVSPCNMNCRCLATTFNPVCGTDGVEYVSPCHAGCKMYFFNITGNKIQNYTDCACSDFAEPGPCRFSCNHYLISLISLLGLILMVGCLCHTPSFILVLRAVPEETTSFAIGIQSLIIQALGLFPIPILLGAIFDNTCIQWDRKCGRITYCQYYDNDLLRIRFIGFHIILLVVTFLCFLIVYCVIRNHPPQTAVVAVKENYAETVE
ncbi:solute carrier organic anion transporter family member 2A1-like [Amblyraja radiata]|uniref:solute carrier organic anion transporter family member 2A1-like n=1 Tax=Amblyraja radiata TaxID=386614 RepID=UPI001401F8C6|nr:solute carrier organic anion transporter family member 2A1-like [Amblyraja radiata]